MLCLSGVGTLTTGVGVGVDGGGIVGGSFMARQAGGTSKAVDTAVANKMISVSIAYAVR